MPKRAEIIAAERRLLRFFCQEASRLPASHLAWQKAGDHAWMEPEHEAMYSALCALRAAPPGQLLTQLPAQLARLGFPDVEWDELFEGSILKPEQALQILSDLAEGQSQ